MSSDNLVIGRLSACLQGFGYSDYFSIFLTSLLFFLFCSLQDMIMSGRTDVCIW